MAPTYAAVPSDEEVQSHQSAPSKRTRVWIKLLWVLQGLIALLRILLVALLLAATFIVAAMLGVSGLVLVIVWM